MLSETATVVSTELATSTSHALKLPRNTLASLAYEPSAFKSPTTNTVLLAGLS